MRSRLIAVLCLPLFFRAAAHAQAPGQTAVAPTSQPGVCATVEQSNPDASCLKLSFEGEVSAKQTFAQEFGGGLVFRLNPAQASGGWFIEVVPKGSDALPEQEYVWVVTPPYHFGNQRYLDTSYGVAARESVQNSPREFNFVLSENQYKEASRLVDLAISSRPASDTRSQEEAEKESQDAAAALMSFPVATGSLSILDSRVTDPSGKGDFGSIEWLKFKVEVRVPCGFPVTAGTGRLSVDSSRCGEIQGAKRN